MLLLAAKSKSGSPVFFILLIGLYAAVYFFYLRPRSRKNKAARLQVRKVEIGQRAKTIGGFVGTVIKDQDGLITLRSASGVELDFIPSAIAGQFDPVVPHEEHEEHQEHEEHEEGDKK